LGGLLVTAPMAMAGGAVEASAVYVDGMADKLGDDTVRIVWEAQTLLFAATAAGILLFTLAAALGIRRTGALPAYTMWLGFLGALANLVAIFSNLDPDLAALGLVGLIGFAIFLLGAGIAVALGKATPAVTTM
jgi:hypothetical protein